MRQWLAELQHRPKAYRQRVALTGAAGVTSLILLLWVISLPERFHALTQTVAEPAGETEEDVAGFLANVRTQVAAVGESIQSLREVAEPAADTEPDTDTVLLATTTSIATATSTQVAVASSTATRTPSVVVPTLSSSTIRRLNPRPIRIATSSATTS